MWPQICIRSGLESEFVERGHIQIQVTKPFELVTLGCNLTECAPEAKCFPCKVQPALQPRVCRSPFLYLGQLSFIRFEIEVREPSGLWNEEHYRLPA